MAGPYEIPWEVPGAYSALIRKAEERLVFNLHRSVDAVMVLFAIMIIEMLSSNAPSVPSTTLGPAPRV